MLLKVFVFLLAVFSWQTIMAGNLIQNGDFEKFDHENGQFTSFEFNRKMIRHRKEFFMPEASEKKRGQVLKVVGVKGHPYNRIGMVMEQHINSGFAAGDKLTLAFEAKADGAAGEEKNTAVEICQMRENGKSIVYNKILIDLERKEWTEYTLTFPIQKGTASLALRIVSRNLDNSDSVLIDNLFLGQAN